MSRAMKSQSQSQSKRRPSSKAEEAMLLHRFLRPGALARLRDDRIVITRRSRSRRSAITVLVSFATNIDASSPPDLANRTADHRREVNIDGPVAHSAAKSRIAFGPRIPLRKKLVAFKPYLLPTEDPPPDLALDQATAAP